MTKIVLEKNHKVNVGSFSSITVNVQVEGNAKDYIELNQILNDLLAIETVSSFNEFDDMVKVDAAFKAYAEMMRGVLPKVHDELKSALARIETRKLSEDK